MFDPHRRGNGRDSKYMLHLLFLSIGLALKYFHVEESS